MKSKQTIKRRNRLEGQIATAAKTDTGVAYQLAKFGHKLTQTEWKVWIYLDCQELRKQPDVKTIDPLTGKAVLRKQLGAQNLLVDHFLYAVNNHDGNTLREIAKAVETYRVDSSDKLRARILTAKRILDSQGRKWTIKQLAGLLSMPPSPFISLENTEVHAPPSEDGYSALRRLAKSLNFPLAKGTKETK